MLELDEDGIMAHDCIGEKIPWSDVARLRLRADYLYVCLKYNLKSEKYVAVQSARVPVFFSWEIGLPIAELGGQRYQIVDFAKSLGVEIDFR